MLSQGNNRHRPPGSFRGSSRVGVFTNNGNTHHFPTPTDIPTYNQDKHSHLPASVPLFLSTRDSTSTSTWFPRWNITNFLLNHQKDDFSLSLDSVSIPNMVYPINQYNATIYFSEDSGATITSVLPYNNYTGTQFAAALATLLNADGTFTYTITYDNQSKKLTIGVVGGTCTFIPGSNQPYQEMGLGSEELNVAFTSLTPLFPINLSGTQYVDIISSAMTHSYSSTHTANVLVRIPMNAPFGNIVFFNNQIPHDVVIHSGHALNSIQLEIRDDKGNAFENPSTAHTSFYFTIKT